MTGIFENLWVKLASVVLAILLWFHVATDKVYQHTLTMQLNQVDISGDLVLLEPPPDSIRVSVSARGKTLLRTDWKKRGLKLSVGRGFVGRFKVDLSTSNLSLNGTDNVELVDIIQPRDIYLTCDTKLEKDVPVRSMVVVMPDEGYAASENDSIVPSTVTVIGPKRYMNEIEYVATQKSVLEGVRNDFSKKVAIKYPDYYGISIKPDSVEAYIVVLPVKRRSFAEIPIHLVNAPPARELEINPTAVDIRVSGVVNLMDSLKIGQISAIADYFLANDSGWIPVNIVIPPSISLLQKSVDSVKVIEIK